MTEVRRYDNFYLAFLLTIKRVAVFLMTSNCRP